MRQKPSQQEEMQESRAERWQHSSPPADSECLPRDHRAPRKLVVEAPVNATAGGSSGATPTYLLTVEMHPVDLVKHTNCLYE